MFGPARIVDALNRIRGPFNVLDNRRMLAAVAAIEDNAHVQMSKAHTEQVAQLAHGGDHKTRSQGDAERGEFRLDPFPRSKNGKTAG